MKNSIHDLRNHLFEVIEQLKTPSLEERTLDPETATAICLAAKRLLETAELELRYRDMTNGRFVSDFLRDGEVKRLDAPKGSK